MPLFDALLSKLKQPKAAVAYLLLPGFTGALPTAGTIYMHRAHALAYTAPPSNVILIGTASLAWGDDPVSLARRELTEIAQCVEVLGPALGAGASTKKRTRPRTK